LKTYFLCQQHQQQHRRQYRQQQQTQSKKVQCWEVCGPHGSRYWICLPDGMTLHLCLTLNKQTSSRSTLRNTLFTSEIALDRKWMWTEAVWVLENGTESYQAAHLGRDNKADRTSFPNTTATNRLWGSCCRSVSNHTRVVCLCVPWTIPIHVTTAGAWPQQLMHCIPAF
jgi:hypothetical protein